MKRVAKFLFGARSLALTNVSFWIAAPIVLLGIAVCVYLVDAYLNIDSPTGEMVALTTLAEADSPVWEAREITPGEIQRKLAAPITQAKNRGDSIRLISASLPTSAKTDRMLDLTFLRVEAAQFWLIYAADADHPNGEIVDAKWEHAKSGVALAIPRHEGSRPLRMVGWYKRANSLLVEAYVYQRPDYILSAKMFNRQGSALLGAFASFAVLAAIIGLRNRDVTFILFAGWLLTSFRVAAVNGGWDFYFFGFTPRWSANLLIMRLTVAAFSVLTIELFRAIFLQSLTPKQFKVCGSLRLVTLSHGIAAVAIPHALFQHYFWASSVLVLVALLAMLADIFRRERSTVSFLYGASWLILLLGACSEILAAANIPIGIRSLLNMQVGSIFSALVCALALAERIRVERDGRLQAQRETVVALEQFRDTYDTVPIGLFSIDPQGWFLQFNPTFSKMLPAVAKVGEPELSPVGHTRWTDVFGRESLAQLLDALSAGRVAQLEITDTRASRWYQVRAHRRAELIEGSIEDVTVRRAAQVQLQRLADHDSLTDLLNRRGFEEILKKLLESDAALGHCLAYVDLDRFKLINDMFGHASGDIVIRSAAERMRTFFADSNCRIARLGGDEFAILFVNASLEHTRTQCERLVTEVIARPFHVADNIFAVAGSAGIVEISQGMTANEALSAADRACADAKHNGGSCVVSYSRSDATLAEHFEELRMISQMHAELPVGRMLMHVQPIVSLLSPASSLSYEAVLRLKGPDGALTGPFKLISAAERHGFMSRVDRWVLQHMIEWLEGNPEHVQSLNYCAINLSGASLNDERFVHDVTSMIQDSPTISRKLCFEITETVALYDLDNTRRFVDRVRGLGARVALDDFGAGYTSFQYLKELNVDLIKIDGGFVRSILEDQSNYTITRTIVDLAHELGMASVAEWVERPDIVRALAQMGVNYGQGYALSRPVPLDYMLDKRSGLELIDDPEVRAILAEKRIPRVRPGRPEIQPAPSPVIIA